MKKMKYIVFLFIVSFILVLASCGDNRKITNYYLNESGNLIAEYDNGETTDLGDFDESIIKSINSVSFSNDGYYIIVGVKTAIKVDFSKVKMSEDGYYVINDIKTTIKVDFSKVEMSDDGYYVINGIKTPIKVDFSKVEMSEDGYYVINGIKTNIKVDFSKVEISEDGYYIINGIKTTIVATNIYKVEFTNCASITSQSIKEGFKVERPQNPQKEGYTFDGWYCNGEEWRFNSDVVMNDMVLTAKWTANNYTVSFKNAKGTNPNNISVTFDSSYLLPSVDPVEGYTFDGWYYNDVKVESDKWNIADNVELVAKWVANENTIILDAKEGNVSASSVTVTYGEDYKLPVPTNEYGVFNGWQYNGEFITDSLGNSLEPWAYTQDITVSVEWIIHLTSVEDLQKLNLYKNAVFSLDADLDISGEEWLPIGTDNSLFTGTINGNGHKIKGLTITEYDSDIKNYGFIGTGKSFKIDNLILEDVNIELKNVKSNVNVGALVGKGCGLVASDQYYGVIDNCSVSGSVVIKPHTTTYTTYVGGIVGSYSHVMNSVNNSTVSGYDMAGGIIGGIGYAINCRNVGNVTGKYSYGICDMLNDVTGAIECVNSGTITGTYASGISSEGTAEKCINTGKIIGTELASGIIGLTGSALYCINKGIIECEGTACGISRGQSVNCYNTGNVTGNAAYGIGFGAINCYNLGTITATYNNAYGIGIGSTRQCASFGKIMATSDSKTYAISPSSSAIDCYYGQDSSDAYNKAGTETTLQFGEELYLDLMFWDKYNPQKEEGYWIISETDYPKLWWEN